MYDFAGTICFTWSARVMCSRTSAFLWSTFTRRRPERPVQRCWGKSPFFIATIWFGGISPKSDLKQLSLPRCHIFGVYWYYIKCPWSVFEHHVDRITDIYQKAPNIYCPRFPDVAYMPWVAMGFVNLPFWHWSRQILVFTRASHNIPPNTYEQMLNC